MIAYSRLSSMQIKIAILVLFLFVIMLLNVDEDAQSERSGVAQKVAALISAALFAGILAGLFWRDTASQEVASLTDQSISLESLAHRLFAAINGAPSITKSTASEISVTTRLMTA